MLKMDLGTGDLCDNIGLVGVSSKWSYVTASPSHRDQVIPILSPLLFMHVGHPYIPILKIRRIFDFHIKNDNNTILIYIHNVIRNLEAHLLCISLLEATVVYRVQYSCMGISLLSLERKLLYLGKCLALYTIRTLTRNIV